MLQCERSGRILQVKEGGGGGWREGLTRKLRVHAIPIGDRRRGERKKEHIHATIAVEK